MNRPLVLAIDGGQTSTKALIADTEGNVLGRGTGSPCDHIQGPHGYERNRAAIQSAARAAIADAAVDASAIVAAGMGLTSCPPELDAKPLFEEMLREIVQPAYVWISHDAASNLAGASAGGPGIVVIAGGGSIAYGVDDNGNEFRAGGMGYLMGDEGSAWWIGLRAIHAAAGAADGRGDDTDLLPYVLEHYSIPTIRHIVSILYGPDFRRDQVSALAPDVVRIAHDDAVAREIVTAAGIRLARLANAVARRLFADQERVNVYPTGGVFQAGPLITEPFRRTLLDEQPCATIREPQFAPVYGALFRACQAMNVRITPQMLQNLRG